MEPRSVGGIFNAKFSRADSRDFQKMAREQDIELKRARGEVSCAECRRLKLKCDKQVPCASCVRRGCSAICPNGSLLTNARQKTRTGLIKSDKLQSRILQLIKRICQLEDALQIAHAALSSAPHPLMSEELLSLKTGFDAPDEADVADADFDVFTSFGKLTLSEGGESQFDGCSGSDALKLGAREECGAILFAGRSAPTSSSNVPEDIALLSEAFPFASALFRRDAILQRILSHLPSRERATALVEAYLEHLSWFFRPIEREQIMEELIPKLYDRSHEADACFRIPGSSEEGTDNEIHGLSLLLMVFALGAVADLTQSPSNDEAEFYKHLARAALGLSPVFQNTSMATVQTVVMMGAYDFFSCRTDTLETSWRVITFALCLGASIDLHRDPARWNYPPKLVQRRRSLFWELSTMDSWRSLSTGKPRIFRTHEVDCQFPEDKEAYVSESGSVVSGLWRWKHAYGKDVVSKIGDHLCSTRLQKYSEVLELDVKIRDYPRQPASRDSASSRAPCCDHVSQAMGDLFREISLIFIHRNFFARAMNESPINPLRSPFGPSFLASYASATKLLGILRVEFDKSYCSLLRHWPLWANAFAAGVIVGVVALRDTASAFASTAPQELDLAIALFEKAVQHPVVENGLPIFRRLREKTRMNRDVANNYPIRMSPIVISASSGGKSAVATIRSAEDSGGTFDSTSQPTSSTETGWCTHNAPDTVQQGTSDKILGENMLLWLGEQQQQIQAMDAHRFSTSQWVYDDTFFSGEFVSADVSSEQHFAGVAAIARTPNDLDKTYQTLLDQSSSLLPTDPLSWGSLHANVFFDNSAASSSPRTGNGNVVPPDIANDVLPYECPDVFSFASSISESGTMSIQQVPQEYFTHSGGPSLCDNGGVKAR